jgi:hypothetical protein
LRGKQHAFNKQPRVAESALAHSDDSEYVYHLAEKIVLHLGSIYEWPRTAITTFAGLQGSLKHNKQSFSMGRFQFAVWAIGNGCPIPYPDWMTHEDSN